MHVLTVRPGADVPPEAIVCHDVRNPAQRNEIFARKGSSLSASEVRALFERGVSELNLAVPAADDVGENEAAARLAEALMGSGLTSGTAHFGQVSLSCSARGMLRISSVVLEHANLLDGVLVVTAEGDRPVDVGTTVAVIKCAPLFLSSSTLDAVAALGAVVSIEPFRALRVALVAPRERLRGGALDRSRAALGQALEWYGSSLDHVVAAEATVTGMAEAYASALDAGADLVLAAGAAATDVLDVVFEGLRQAGGEVDQIGIPAEPGTACWIGRLGVTPVLGLASCELFGQPGALDLLLPPLLTGAPLDRHLVRRLAFGGLLLGPSRIAPYHAAQEA